MYDYGKFKNLQVYKNEKPPLYDLNQIEGIKLAIVYGTNDRLVNCNDVEWLIDQLKGKNEILLSKKLNDFGHVSVLVSKDISWFNEVYEKIK